MKPNQTKELIRRWIAFANAGFVGSFDEFIAPGYVGHLGASDMDRFELERLEREFRRAFPDTQHSIDDLIAEDDRVALRTTARATHRADFQGVARTGRQVEFTAMVIYRIQHVGETKRGRESFIDIIQPIALQESVCHVVLVLLPAISPIMC